jgi:hypothetical protein
MIIFNDLGKPVNSDERYGWCRVRDESAISRCRRAGADGPSVFVASCSVIPRRAPSFADIALPRQDVSCFCYFRARRLSLAFAFAAVRGGRATVRAAALKAPREEEAKRTACPKDERRNEGLLAE